MVNETARVVHVADGGDGETQDPAWLAGLETVAMDMRTPYIRATMDHVPKVNDVVALGRFHVARLLGHAVDAVRRIEHGWLKQSGDASLGRTRYWCLHHPDNISTRRWAGFQALKVANPQTTQTWEIKGHAMCLRHYKTRLDAPGMAALKPVGHPLRPEGGQG